MSKPEPMVKVRKLVARTEVFISAEPLRRIGIVLTPAQARELVRELEAALEGLPERDR